MYWTVFYLRVPIVNYCSHQIDSGQGAVHHANFPQSLKHAGNCSPWNSLNVRTVFHHLVYSVCRSSKLTRDWPEPLIALLKVALLTSNREALSSRIKPMACCKFEDFQTCIWSASLSFLVFIRTFLEVMNKFNFFVKGRPCNWINNFNQWPGIILSSGCYF